MAMRLMKGSIRRSEWKSRAFTWTNSKIRTWWTVSRRQTPLEAWPRVWRNKWIQLAPLCTASMLNNKLISTSTIRCRWHTKASTSSRRHFAPQEADWWKIRHIHVILSLSALRSHCRRILKKRLRMASSSWNRNLKMSAHHRSISLMSSCTRSTQYWGRLKYQLWSSFSSNHQSSISLQRRLYTDMEPQILLSTSYSSAHCFFKYHLSQRENNPHTPTMTTRPQCRSRLNIL